MEKNYASLQQRVGDPVETCKAQHVSMEEKLNELSVMYDDLEQYTTKFNLYIYIWEMSIHTVLSVVGNSTFAKPETLARMPYLKAWLRETLRLNFE